MSKYLLILIITIFIGLGFFSQAYALVSKGGSCCEGSNLDLYCGANLICDGDNTAREGSDDTNWIISCGDINSGRWGTCVESTGGNGNGSAVGFNQPKECCKLNQKITLDKDSVNRLSGGTTGISGNCMPNASCDLEENSTVGAPGSICPLNNKNNIKNKEPDIRTEGWGIICLLNSIATVTNWLFILLTILVVFMVLYGAFNLITSAGDPKKTDTGKKIITYAIIGLAIAILAKIIPSIVKFIVGV